MKKIFVTGMSATGKSTLANELRSRGVAVFDIDDLDGACDWYDKNTGEKAVYQIGVGKQWLYDHEWRCDFAKIKEKLDRVDSAKLAVVVGITSNQFDHFDLFDRMFVLRLSDEAQIYRLNHRTTNDFASDPKEQEYILETKTEFENKMIECGAIPIDASLPVELLADKVMEDSSV